MTTVALVLAVASPAHAQGAPSFADGLQAAKESYFSGDTQASLEAFQQLQLRAMQRPDDQPWSEVVEALSYLGEIHVKVGDDAAAKRVFRYILERDLQAAISPYRHPIEVVFLFNQVRDQVAAERSMEEPEVVTIPPPRWHAHLPLGLPQFAQGRPVAGAVYGLGQAALGATSIAMFVELRRLNQSTDTHPLAWTEDQIASGVAWRRWGAQWPATVGFYGLWAVSVIDARSHWRREHAPAQLGVLPAAGGRPGMTLVGRF